MLTPKKLMKYEYGMSIINNQDIWKYEKTVSDNQYIIFQDATINIRVFININTYVMIFDIENDINTNLAISFIDNKTLTTDMIIDNFYLEPTFIKNSNYKNKIILNLNIKFDPIKFINEFDIIKKTIYDNKDKCITFNFDSNCVAQKLIFKEVENYIKTNKSKFNFDNYKVTVITSILYKQITINYIHNTKDNCSIQ